MVVTTGGAGVIVVLSTLLGLAPEVPIQRPGQAPDTATTAPAETATEPPTPAETPTPTAPATAETGPESATEQPDAATGAEGEADADPEPAAPLAPPPPTVSPELARADDGPVYDLDEHDRKLRRASSFIAAGAVTATAGLVMLIGAGTEAAKPDCKFDLDTCPNAPRPAVARGLGIGSAIALAGGAAMLTYGLVRRHRLRTGIGGDRHSVALTFAGRF